MNSVYRVSIYDKSKKLVASYEKIHTIKYIDAALDQCVVSGNEIASHFFPTSTAYQLLSDDGNYSIDASIVGTFEVNKVVY